MEHEPEEEGWTEDAPNPTQEQMGEGEDVPVDVSWEEEPGEWGEPPDEPG